MVTLVRGFSAGRPVHLCGHGYFAGEAPATADPDDPDGRAKIVNVPSRVRVGVYERQTMLCLATALSGNDGLWRVAGLHPSIPFTVIGFDNAATVNAAIQDWVKPAAYDPASLRAMRLVGYVGDGNLGSAVSWKVRAAYAVGAVSYAVTSGALPPGWSISSVETSCLITGTSTTAGDYSFELTGTDADSNEASATYHVAVREAFTYWRIVITANNGNGSYATVVEVELRATPGGLDQANGGTASATSFANTDNLPSFAFDNNASTKWTTASRPTNVAPQTLKYQCASPIVVTQVAITGAIGGQTDMAPRDFTIERSNDNSTWEIVGTFAGVTGWAANETRLFSV
jgi:hypothetical protein